jgi:hypothetical protein
MADVAYVSSPHLLPVSSFVCAFWFVALFVCLFLVFVLLSGVGLVFAFAVCVAHCVVHLFDLAACHEKQYA